MINLVKKDFNKVILDTAMISLYIFLFLWIRLSKIKKNYKTPDLVIKVEVNLKKNYNGKDIKFFSEKISKYIN
jgi:hypothetical protein